MKLLKLFTIGVFFALALATVQASDAVRIHAPFPFVVAGKEFPAGHYIIQQSGDAGVLLIRGEGHAAALLTGSAESSLAGERAPGVRFTSAGGEKYLKQVQMPGGPPRVVLANSAK
jgi:hypothetical protein